MNIHRIHAAGHLSFLVTFPWSGNDGNVLRFSFFDALRILLEIRSSRWSTLTLPEDNDASKRSYFNDLQNSIFLVTL